MVIASLLLVACGSSGGSSDSTPTPPDRPGQKVILDTDFLTDMDDAGAVATAFALMKTGELNVIGIITSGHDGTGRREMAIRAIATYYGFGDVPIGHRFEAGQREAHTRGAVQNPKLNSAYAGDYRDISEFPNTPVATEDAVDLYCRLLKNANTKVDIPVLGSQYSVEMLLRETDKCNGKQLMAEKVRNLILVGGIYTSNWDMNFGSHVPFHTYTANVSNYVNNNTPEQVRTVLVDYKAMYKSRVGSSLMQYNVNSPQAFLYATQGTYLTVGAYAWDTSAVVFSARGAQFWNTQTGTMVLDSHARVSWIQDPAGRYLKLFPKPNSAEFKEGMESFLRFEP